MGKKKYGVGHPGFPEYHYLKTAISKEADLDLVLSCSISAFITYKATACPTQYSLLWLEGVIQDSMQTKVFPSTELLTGDSRDWTWMLLYSSHTTDTIWNENGDSSNTTSLKFWIKCMDQHVSSLQDNYFLANFRVNLIGWPRSSPVIMAYQKRDWSPVYESFMTSSCTFWSQAGRSSWVLFLMSQFICSAITGIKN